MFGLASGFYRSYLAPAKLSVLFVGIDGSGKTTLLERVKVTQFRTHRGGTVPDPPPEKLRRCHSEGARELTEKKEQQPIRTAPASPGGDIIWLDDGGGGGVPLRPPANKTSVSPTPPALLQHASSDPVAVARSSSAKLQRKKRSIMRCPAPRAYSRDSMASGDNDEGYDEVVLTPQTSRLNDDDGRDSTTTQRPAANNDNNNSNSAAAAATAEPLSPPSKTKRSSGGRDDSKGITRHRIHHVEHDLKKGAKMLPLHAIRPTLGQNLGKVEACGCKLDILDLGGSEKMRPLWDRYLSDIDAVVFVVDASPLSSRSKLEEAIVAFKGVLTKLRRGGKDEENDIPGRTPEAGVPLLVFANKTDVGDDEVLEEHSRQKKDGDGEPVHENEDGENEPLQIDLDELSSLFHAGPSDSKEESNLTSTETRPGGDSFVAVCRGSAKTGEGVKAAFEWLIPTAKLAQRERQKLS